MAEKFNFSEESTTYLYIFIAFVVVAIGIFFIIRKKIRHLKFYQKSKEIGLGFWHGLVAVTKIKKPVAFIFQSLLIWVLYYLMIYVCVFSLPETAGLGFDAVLSMLIFGSIGIMVVQGGIGIYPAIIAETLILYSITKTYGYALGWLTWTSQTLMIVVAGIASLVLLPVINKKNYEKT